MKYLICFITLTISSYAYSAPQFSAGNKGKTEQQFIKSESDEFKICMDNAKPKCDDLAHQSCPIPGSTAAHQVGICYEEEGGKCAKALEDKLNVTGYNRICWKDVHAKFDKDPSKTAKDKWYLSIISTPDFMSCINQMISERRNQAAKVAEVPVPIPRPVANDNDIAPVVVTPEHVFNVIADDINRLPPETAPVPAAGAPCADDAQIKTLADQCAADSDSAGTTCNTDTDPGLSSASSLGNNLAAGLQGVAATTGTCSQVANYGTAMNGAMATYNQNCSAGRQQCLNSCSLLKQALQASVCTTQSVEHQVAESAYDSKEMTCQNLGTKVGLVQQQSNASLQGIAQATNCANQASAMAAIPTVAACAANPALPGCAAVSSDCSNPTVAASSPVCVCGANPNSASCKALSQTATASGTVGALTGSGGATMSGGNAGSSTAIDIGSATPDSAIAKGNTADGIIAGSTGMNGAGNGAIGGGLVGQATPDAKKSGARYSADILGGTRGSSAVNSFAGSRGSSSSEPTVYQGKYGSDPDLRKFLPGGQFDPRRGVAGATGADGITGPYGDIFQKITTRYSIVTPSLLP